MKACHPNRLDYMGKEGVFSCENASGELSIYSTHLPLPPPKKKEVRHLRGIEPRTFAEKEQHSTTELQEQAT